MIQPPTSLYQVSVNRVRFRHSIMLLCLIACLGTVGEAFGQTPGTKPIASPTTDAKQTPSTAPPDAAAAKENKAPEAEKAKDKKAESLSVLDHISKANELLDLLDNPTESRDTKAVFDEINEHVIAVQTVEPSNPWLYYLLGRSSAARGRSGDAIDQLRRFVETREGRNEWKAYCLLGDQFVSEFPNLAKPNYDKAAALKNNEPKILLGQSRCANRTGDLDGALKLAKAAVEADGHKKPVYLANLAKVYAAKKQWADAESAALEAYKLSEAEAQNHPRLRNALQTLDAQAQQLVDLLNPKSVESDWSEDDAIRLAGYIRRRAESQRRLTLCDAYMVLEKAIKKSPEVPQKLLDEYNSISHELDAAAALP